MPAARLLLITLTLSLPGLALPQPVAEPSAPVYETDRPLGPADAAIAAAVTARWPRLVYSAELAEAARIWARDDASRSLELRPEALEQALKRAGCPEPIAVADAFDTEGDGLEEALERLGTVLDASPEPLTHVGLARISATGSSRWGLVLSRRLVRLQPFPGQLATGAGRELRFALDGGFASPKVLVQANGEATTVPVRQNGEWWSATVTAPVPAGSAWVSIHASDARGEAILAELEVTVAAAAPAIRGRQPALFPCDDLPAEDAEALMVSLANRDRERHGLALLTADTGLAAVARAHSLDMSENGFFAHQSPHHGQLPSRLLAADYRARAARENLSRAADPCAAHTALMASIHHRANLLAPDVTHIGVGMVRVAGADGRPSWLVTQCFATPSRLVSAAQLRAEVTRELQSVRQAAGAPLLRPSEALDRRTASLAGSEALPSTLDLGHDLPTPGDCTEPVPRWRSLRVVTMTLGDLNDLQLPSWVTDLGPTHFGLAVESAVAGEGIRMRVVLALAEASAAPTPDHGRRRLERRIAALRERRGLQPAETDPALDSVARDLADRAADGGALPASPAVPGISAVLLAVDDHDRLVVPEEALAPSLRRLGIGITRRLGERCVTVDTVVLVLGE